jgi:Fe-S oxidoreductase
MDRLREFLEDVRQHNRAQGNFLGLLNVVIGRRISLPDGTPVSTGVTWRELAALLKKIRWEKEAVRELGLKPAELPPRDRQRYWYSAIAQARVASPEATEAGNRFAKELEAAGYQVGPPPGG